MTSLRRWLAVLVGTAVLVALPSAIGRLPAKASNLSAATLLQRIQDSTPVAYSGYAESAGGLALPVTDQFGALANLLGGNTQLRVWWRGAKDWRVDSIGFAGETDVHENSAGYWNWNYENNTATFTQAVVTPAVRTPSDADLLPPEMARRLLSEATAAEATRIGSERIAGHSAAGVRITPSQTISTIDHIDVYADPSTGLPLRVEVAGKGTKNAALTSSFLDVKIAAPAASTTAFVVPQGVSATTSADPDLATLIDQLGGGTPPSKLAGVARNPGLPQLGSIGIYGSGVTEFVVVPLPRRTAYSLHRQLAAATGTASSQSSNLGALELTSGPLSLRLTSFDDPAGPWLLIGTVDSETLAQAATDLPAGTGQR